jgi:hypothetical protein
MNECVRLVPPLKRPFLDSLKMPAVSSVGKDQLWERGMSALYRANSFNPIEKVLPSPSPSGRGAGVRANEPPATVPAKPNQFAVKRRCSGNEPSESLVGSAKGRF